MVTEEGIFTLIKRKESEKVGAYQSGNARLPVSLLIGQCRIHRAATGSAPLLHHTPAEALWELNGRRRMQRVKRRNSRMDSRSVVVAKALQIIPFSTLGPISIFLKEFLVASERVPVMWWTDSGLLQCCPHLCRRV